MKSIQRTMLLLTFGLALGCQKGSVDIGDPMLGATLADYVGTWSGYAEAYSFNPSGSDRLHLTIDPSGQGTMEFGDGPRIPPPTDPNVGYPSDYATRWGATGTYDVTEGFPYPTHEVSVEFGRLRFGLFSNELFAPWCAMQTPIATAFGWYSCVHDDWRLRSGSVADASAMPDCGALACCVVYEDRLGTGTEMVVDCGKQNLCDYPNTGHTICVCTESSCSAAIPEPGQLAANQYPVYLDLALDTGGRKLTGTLVIGLNGPRVTVRLSR